ncbi:hypothetical protein ACP0J1_29440 [Pseudomonas aeruginosa]
MSNIRNVQWNEGAPEKLEPGMLIAMGNAVMLIGHLDHYAMSLSPEPDIYLECTTRWAWLIQPHELAWLEDMANKHKARARG